MKKKITFLFLSVVLLGGAFLLSTTPTLNLGSSILNIEASCSDVQSIIATGQQRKIDINTRLSDLRQERVRLNQQNATLVSQSGSTSSFAQNQQTQIEQFQKDFFAKTQFANEFYLAEAIRKVEFALQPEELSTLRREGGYGFFARRKFRQTVKLFQKSLEDFNTIKTDYDTKLQAKKNEIFTKIQNTSDSQKTLETQITEVVLAISQNETEKRTLQDLLSAINTDLTTLQTKQTACVVASTAIDTNNAANQAATTTSATTNAQQTQTNTTTQTTTSTTTTSGTNTTDATGTTTTSDTSATSTTDTASQSQASSQTSTGGSVLTTTSTTERDIISDVIIDDQNTQTTTTSGTSDIDDTTSGESTGATDVVVVQNNTTTGATQGQSNITTPVQTSGPPPIPPYIDYSFYYRRPVLDAKDLSKITYVQGGQACWFSSIYQTYNGQSWQNANGIEYIVGGLGSQSLIYLDEIYAYTSGIVPKTNFDTPEDWGIYMGKGYGHPNNFFGDLWLTKFSVSGYGYRPITGANNRGVGWGGVGSSNNLNSTKYVAIRTHSAGYRPFNFSDSFVSSAYLKFHGCVGIDDPIPNF